MSQNTIIKPDDFDVSKVKFGMPKSLDNGGKHIPIYYDGNPFMVQTPRMRTPYGVNRWENPGSDQPKLSLDLSFGNYKEDPKLVSFFGMMDSLNKTVLREGLDNSTQWFKKKYTSIDVIEALYTSLIKVSKDKITHEPSDIYPPTFKIALQQRAGKDAFEVYDESKSQIDLSSVEMKGAEMLAIIQCNGIWVAGGKFGCTWRAVQMKVFPSKSVLKRDAFKADPEEDYASFLF